MKFHSQSPEEALKNLQSSINGLDQETVEKIRKKHGWNEIPEKGRTHWIWILLRQLKSLLVFILLIAATISWFIGDMLDVYVILGIVILNAAIGFFLEQKAEKAISALKKMMVVKARVLRNGKSIIVMARELVPGDIVVLEEGDSIPADCRVIESKNLRCIEASLTGESVPVGKQTEALPENTVLADQINMLFKGTFVASGFAKALVSGTGTNTAIGDIADTLSSIKNEKTNFQKKTDILATQMSVLAIVSAIILYVLGSYFSDLSNEELMLISIAALVAAIPEGMPAILSLVLAIGSHRMAKRNVIIRQLNSVETLGAVTVIITDKTGTLTQNRLIVEKIMQLDKQEFKVGEEGITQVENSEQNPTKIDLQKNPALDKLLQIAAISNNSEIKYNQEKKTDEIVGDPTEGALKVMAKIGGIILADTDKSKKIDDLPFNSKLKYRATLFEDNNRRELFVIGAPEKILEISSRFLDKEGEKTKTEDIQKHIEGKIEEWSNDAMRVIGLAYKTTDTTTEKISEKDVSNLVFAGIVSMFDPPRPDVKQSIEKCRNAGIRVIMATGDHVNTAKAIARETGIISTQKENETLALTEADLLDLDENGFAEAIQKIDVFARLSPRMKLKIADHLQAKGELIAMTGDGVNDAPALKKADVGVSMGIMGTDVARDASDVVLADDNFSTIVNAVEEGRIVFTNVRQTSFFLITTNFASLSILIVLVAMGYPIALTATQILWLNLVTDGVADLALAAEKGHGDELSEKPVHKNENILTRKALPILLLIALFMMGMSLVTYFYYLPQGIETARTMVFIVMASSQLFNLYNMRALKKSVFKIGFFSNPYINVSMLFSFAILIGIIEIPFFSSLFKFVLVDPWEFAVLISISSIVLWMGELFKWVKKKSNPKQP
ncbi:HAD-IC family P-type ATPase [Rhodonellum sp.]|uniref:cation-translocating P-type ATPase n=1 Tax=Rhodonellum sp. TaxID=2231180 RepID=UPI0027267216|nr:HAD-IC family P-type ATPase [Rhodonellum sp.]MDO9554266.1 HAD-IC family P-type ATPase [Rhodonellum sp.]